MKYIITFFRLLNIYHSVPEDSKHKADIYEGIIKVCMLNFYPKVLAQHLEFLPAWMESWKLNADGKKHIYGLLAESFEKDNMLQMEEIQVIIEYLKLSPSSTESAKNKLERAITLSMGNPSVLEFDALASSCSWFPANVQEIFQSIQKGDLAALKAKYTTDFQAKYGPLENVERKARVLSLLHLALCHLNKELNYSDVAEKLSVSDDLVETTVIEAVRSGYLGAQMDQLKKTVSFQKIAFFHGLEQNKSDLWKEIKDKISSHQEKVRSLQKLVQNVKKNHQIGKVINIQ